jgi:ABC-2 type transport system permease protein
MLIASVLRGEFTRSWIDVRRYPINSVAGLVILYMFFMAIFLGAKAMAGSTAPAFGENVAGGIVGYCLWFFAIAAMGDMAFQVYRDATTGTLEQLILSPAGMVRILTGRAVGNLLVNFTFVVSLLFLIMLTTGIWLSFPLVPLVPLVLLTLAALWGVGFVLAGLSLNFKRIEVLTNVLQFVFLGLAVVPLSSLPGGVGVLVRLLPFGVGVDAVRQVVIDGATLSQLAESGDLLILIVNSAAYLLFGIMLYIWLDRLARRRGVVGHY